MLNHLTIVKGHGIKYYTGYGELFGFTTKHHYLQGMQIPEVKRALGFTDILSIQTVSAAIAEKEMGYHSKFLKAP